MVVFIIRQSFLKLIQKVRVVIVLNRNPLLVKNDFSIVLFVKIFSQFLSYNHSFKYLS